MISKHNKSETNQTYLDGFSTSFGVERQFSDACDTVFHGHGETVDEFTLTAKSLEGCAEMFELQKLFQLDDHEHFTTCVFNAYGLHQYEVLESHGCHVNFKRFGDVNPLQKRSTALQPVWNLQSELSVRAVSNVPSICRHVDIILDSGSDVTLIPTYMSGIGVKAAASPGTFLRDAQGKEIATTDIRDISFSFDTLDGEQITIKERAYFSDRVDCPLISFGKLLKTGWGVQTSMEGPPVLTHANGAQVGLAFRQNPLVISGDVRLIQNVRAISVDVPRSWFSLPRGWFAMGNFQICSSSATNYVDATQKYLVTQWPYRTTVAFHDTRGWEVVELCEKLFSMDERAAPITGSYARLLTILSKDVLTVSEFGMVISDAVHTEGDGQERSSGSRSSSTAVPVTGDASAAQQRPVAQTLQQQPDVQMSSPAVPQTIAVEPADVVKIAGVDAYSNSSISVLKAACSFLQVSQSGSKQKLWRRILSTLDKQAILAETELAAVALDESQRTADSVQVATPPEDPAVIDAHNLTHLPYQPWCPACVMAKGKPDQHRSDPSKLQRREHPIISWDFCYTGKTCEAVTEKSEGSKLTALVVHDSHTGAVHCIPVQHKSQTKYMSQEIMRFITFLGYGVVALRCDQEPTTLQIQRLVQRARQRLNQRTIIENAKVGDHGSNAAVEKAIDCVRGQASVFLHGLTERIGFQVLPQHPLFAWAFTHAAWTLTRFSVWAGATPFELVSGHAYHSKLCPFGCPVRVYVVDTVQQKGDAKWQRGIFLTKTLSNDMYLTAVGGTIRLTRSLKMLYPNWSEQMETYRQVLTFPWQLEGAVGSRTFPVIRGEYGIALSIPGIDDEAAEEPDDEALPPMVIADFVPVTPIARHVTPPPANAVVSAPATVPATPIVEQQEAAEQVAVQNLGVEQAGMPNPSLQPPGPMTPGMDTDMNVEAVDDTIETNEPEAKRQRLSTMRVGAETYFHVDEDPMDQFQQLGDEFSFSAELDDENMHDVWNDDDDHGREMTEDDLWQPFSALEPVLSEEQLQKIDDYADSVEIERLLGMQVIAKRDSYDGLLGTQLSAKFVRAWRKKTRKLCDESGKVTAEVPGWLRRSRLVAREFNWLDVRDDVYSPSSSSSVVKVLPALAMSDGFSKDCILGTLDIADAFLQVNQPEPRVVRLGTTDWVILKCLPGQRDASKLWYQFFTEQLKQKFNATVCVEQPCVLKVSRKAAMVLHVDDVLFMGDQQWIETVFLPGLRKEFKLSSTVVDRQRGGSFEFLKRFHVVEPFYKESTVFPEEKHVHALYDRYCRANGKPPKLSKTPCNPSSFSSSVSADDAMSESLSEALSAEYRSLVGIAMYMSQERFDVQFATKSLAASLKSPTRQSWSDLGRLVGYLKFSERFALKMARTRKGASFQDAWHGVETENQNNLIETFSDSDWSGRSTSSAIHALNGVVIWSTSRTQKCISLSSTEAKWYAATSGVCDGLFIHHILSFLCDSEVGPLVLFTDNSAVRMLSKKLGAGRLRHIKGRLLWLQEKVLAGDLIIKQIKTVYNVADLNTKALPKDRHLCLLHLLGFVCDGESVGELEYNKLQAREMLKQQVNAVSETFAVQMNQKRTSSTNKFAKQFLRALSVMSVMSLADGQGLDKALSLWHAQMSPMMLAGAMVCLSVFLVILYMTPGASGSGEAMEPSPEPEVSRYPTNSRSLGLKYPQVFSDVMFRAEGVIIWLYDRCEKRVNRSNKPILNGFRQRTLKEMMHKCMRGLIGPEKQQMKENLLAMTDLTDDEESPRFGMRDEQVHTECLQAVQAYDVGIDLLRLERDAGTQNAGDDENEDEHTGESMRESGESEAESEGAKWYRYIMANVEDVSEPDLWEEIQQRFREEGGELAEYNPDEDDSMENEAEALEVTVNEPEEETNEDS
eukprot:s948_g8.t1